MVEELISEIGGGRVDKDLIHEILVPMHPTHQQSLMRIMVMLIREQSEIKYTDLRNQKAKEIAEKMLEGLDGSDLYLPYI